MCVRRTHWGEASKLIWTLRNVLERIATRVLPASPWLGCVMSATCSKGNASGTARASERIGRSA